MENTFTDRIYEASVIPEYWPQVLREFAQLAEAKGTILLISNGESKKFVGSSKQFEQAAGEFYAHEGALERTRRLVALQRAGFVTDFDVFTEAEILEMPVFADYLIPNGYGRGIATAIQVPTGDNIVFHCERDFHAGAFASGLIRRLDALRPHLARASLLSARLGIAQARAAAESLAAVGLPAAVLGHGGRVLAANNLLVAMMPHIVQDRPRRLALAEPNADALLRAAFEAVGDSSAPDAVRSIPIRALEEHPPVIIHLVPVRGAAHDIFAAATAILLATPVMPKQVPGADVIQALFDLTPAEARVARAIGNGETTASIAAAFGTSVTTVRNHLAAVMAKSGLHRQAELVGLLQGTGI